MKKTILALSAILAVGSASATDSTPTSAGTVTVTGSGSNTVSSSTAAGSYVFGTGSSVSKAINTQSSSAYVGGTGFLTSGKGNQYVTTADCDPAVKVSGTTLNGSVHAVGGTSASGFSNASNVSTGGGAGGAAAAGGSYAEVAGKVTATGSNASLSAEGTSFSGVLTSTSVGTNQIGPVSKGSTSSSFNDSASLSLFKYSTGSIVGDTKTATTSVITRAGDLNCISGCGNTVTKAVAINATVEAGATGAANAELTAVIVKP